MKLIADSGSTKTDWAVLSSSRSECHPASIPVMTTQGLNPFHQQRDEILGVLRQELLSKIDADIIESVNFYGSGVRPELEPAMVSVLQEAFPLARTVEAHSDMLGAARALCGRQSGIACILGTGANSCLYDGRDMIANTPALGYILGDEGSGAVLGKRLVHDLYKDVLSKEIKMAFELETGLSLVDVITRVYRQPLPNRFLASLSEFIGRHLHDWPSLRDMVIDSFKDFFRFNIQPYQRPDLSVSFVGSIAYYYEAELREAASDMDYAVGAVMRSPIEGLAAYHIS